ncbi:sodium:proton antiporter NhaD [Alkalimarinus alittae]|uniref:Sodium:proton antiporter NhaD n=2 Tax=Alkalimarinus alittae TaxID=2961619 RepID=A0ABY6N779_9ALTE|nr:sodium:proton antiporter NhaD [Alkalimarinus alittae]UZE97976.1 sodium:proton antiporter NhaD [Alkalimarinus alittae]
MGHLDMTTASLGIVALIIFVLAYGLVIAEEFIHLRKSKPVILAASIIWILVALLARGSEHGKELVEVAINHNLLEYAALLLFLLTAMVYVNAMTERNVFEALRSWLVRKGFSYRQLFWITGFLAFFISPIADNLTTALLMGAVVLAVGADKPKFVALSFINIVVAANAGGAFSPFGDITTLMVWQSGHVDFFGFFGLFIPAVVNFLVPAIIMNFAVPNETPTAAEESVALKKGALVICLLFLCTIMTAVSFEQVLHLPPFLGMMMGLSYLFFFSYYLKITLHRASDTVSEFNIFTKVARAEWDTLLFFFGVIFCVGGLGTIGYLAYVSHFLYEGLGATNANIIAGLLSAVVDNIPVMFAILTMNPEMDTYQWLLVTMTAGVGGSLLSVGSAAGVALMGQSRGMYTFFSHMKWSWAIALGYAASIYAHYLING